jgi:hypothetical protein
MSGINLEIGSRFAKHSRRGLLGALAVAGLCMMRPAAASAQLIESFENTLDGWTFDPTTSTGSPWYATNSQSVAASFSNTIGVTNGSYSLVAAPTLARTGWGPNYGPLLDQPSSLSETLLLSHASAISLDVTVPAGSFGYYLQFDMDLGDGSGSALGNVSLDGYNYQAATIGGTATLTFPITPAQDAALASDYVNGFPSSLQIQVGGGTTPGSDTFYLDNIRAIPVPEPASLGLLGAGASALLVRRRKA